MPTKRDTALINAGILIGAAKATLSVLAKTSTLSEEDKKQFSIAYSRAIDTARAALNLPKD